MRLRDYQERAVSCIREAWVHDPACLLVLPTGTGKTVVFAHVIQERRHRGRALVLAHRQELVYQAADKIAAVTGTTPGIEMAESEAGTKMFPSDIVVGTIQTMSSVRRRARYRPGHFSTIVIDEAHHATASSYRKVIEHFTKGNPECRVLGVTATPDRSDQESLGKVFNSVAMSYEIRDAVKDGYLVPIKQHSVYVKGLDFSKVRTTAGDLNGGDLAEIMENERSLQSVAAPLVEIAGTRKTIVFAVTVRHAERLAEIINRYHPGSSRVVHGKTPKGERADLFRDFTAGDFNYLVNVGVLTEGYDEPGVECVAVARPTKSRALYAQMVGRGTRPLPGVLDGAPGPGARVAAIAGSRKPAVEVIDFEGNAGRHKLCCPVDILGGDLTDRERERAKELAREDPERDIEDVVEEAVDEVAEQIKREQEEAEAKAKRARLRAKASYKTQRIDPFDVFDRAPPVVRDWERARPITSKQIEALQGFGIAKKDMPKTLTEAASLLDVLVERSQSQACTYKQAKLLKARGYDVRGLTVRQAGVIISKLRRNAWKPIR